MDFSVALCTYNGAAYVREQLDSIVAGTVLPRQIVVCDDRSPDDTAAIVSEFASRSPVPVELHVNAENLGYVRNFEKAISLCTATIIFLSDQDDVWAPHKAATILARFADPEVGGVFSDAALAYADLTPMNMTMFSRLLSNKYRTQLITGDRDDMFRFLLARPIVTGATLAFRRSLVDALIPFPESRFFIHDGWLALAISAMSTLAVVDLPLVTYRQHPMQQVGLPKEDTVEADHRARYPTLRRDYARLYAEVARALQRRPGVRSGARKLLEDAIAHNEVRLSLAERRVTRPTAVLGEVLKGRYARYSSGMLSAAKDLLRPQRR